MYTPLLPLKIKLSQQNNELTFSQNFPYSDFDVISRNQKDRYFKTSIVSFYNKFSLLSSAYIEPKIVLPLETTTLTMMMMKMNKTTRIVTHINLQIILFMESLEAGS